jgi:Tfp pilus assembly protein PilX
MVKHLYRNQDTRDEHGLILIVSLLVVSAMMLVGITLLGYTTSQFKLTTVDTFRANAQLVAEAGVEQSLQQLNQNDTFAGYTSQQTFFDSATQGKGVYTTVIANINGSPSAKTITSTGLVYRNAASSVVVSKRIVQVTTVGTASAGYSVESGPGGLILGGGAAINNADVYVDGTLTMTGLSRIGTGLLPTNLFVANDACPAGANPGASYPSICASGQPISLTASTSIFGTVCATGQTSTGPNNNIQPGVSGQGLKPNCVAPPTSTPPYDRAAHIAAVTTTASANSAPYACGFPFMSTWTPHLELTGNVRIGTVCNLTIKGDTYITGDLDISGASKIIVDPSVGTTRPVVLVDGKITVGGSAVMLANLQGTGVEFISWSSTAPCNPGCTSVTGTNLKTSSGTDTITIGGGAISPGMVYDAYWGKISVSGSGTIGAAIGQTVDLRGAGNITFGTGLSSGSKTWTITSYQQSYQ